MEAIVGVLVAAIVGGAAIFSYAIYLTSGSQSEGRSRSFNYNPEDNNVYPVLTMQEYFCSQVEEERSFEKALSILVRPYRCKGCYHRFVPLFQTILANARSSENVEAGQAEGNPYCAERSEC
jgi:hypothetical protein